MSERDRHGEASLPSVASGGPDVPRAVSFLTGAAIAALTRTGKRVQTALDGTHSALAAAVQAAFGVREALDRKVLLGQRPIMPGDLREHCVAEHSARHQFAKQHSVAPQPQVQPTRGQLPSGHGRQVSSSPLAKPPQASWAPTSPALRALGASAPAALDTSVPSNALAAAASASPVHAHTRTFPVPAYPALCDAVQGACDTLVELCKVCVGGTSDALEAAYFQLVAALARVEVNACVKVLVERGGRQHARTIAVCDLHALIPCQFLEISGAVIHPLSYMAARNNALPVMGCYVSQPGYMLSRADVAQHAVITAIGKTKVYTLQDLANALAALPDATKVPVRHFILGDKRERVQVIQIDRRWFELILWTRNDTTGLWDATVFPPPPPRPRLLPQSTTFPSLPATHDLRRHTRLASDGAELFGLTSPPARPGTSAYSLMFRALVMVEFHIPQMCDGVHASSFIGVGVVTDKRRGLVVVDRNTVPAAVGNIQLTFAASLEVPATVLYMHPIHNFAILQYDPALIGTTPVTEVRLVGYAERLSPDKAACALDVGDSCEFVGLSVSHTPIVQSCTVTKVERIVVADASPPRYREYNSEVIHFDRVASCLGGIFAKLDVQNTSGMTGEPSIMVGAIYASYSYTDGNGDVREMSLGMPVDFVADVVNPLRENGECVCLLVFFATLVYQLSE